MDCKQEENLVNCKCTYPGCPRKGICCECIRHHLANRELPGCCFDKEGEASYDRSFEHFAKLVSEKKV
jgi:hypothetical protein